MPARKSFSPDLSALNWDPVREFHVGIFDEQIRAEACRAKIEGKLAAVKKRKLPNDPVFSLRSVRIDVIEAPESKNGVDEYVLRIQVDHQQAYIGLMSAIGLYARDIANQIPHGEDDAGESTRRKQKGTESMMYPSLPDIQQMLRTFTGLEIKLVSPKVERIQQPARGKFERW